MDVQIGGRAKSLYQRDRTGVGCGAFHAGLLEQKHLAMTRWMMRSTGVSSSGWAANKMRSGIGNDSTHCLTGTREADDITNATNRSPYPTLHLLREDSVERAVAAFPEAESIFEHNIDTMRRLGPDGWKLLFRR